MAHVAIFNFCGVACCTFSYLQNSTPQSLENTEYTSLVRYDREENFTILVCDEIQIQIFLILWNNWADQSQGIR